MVSPATRSAYHMYPSPCNSLVSIKSKCITQVHAYVHVHVAITPIVCNVHVHDMLPSIEILTMSHTCTGMKMGRSVQWDSAMILTRVELDQKASVPKSFYLPSPLLENPGHVQRGSAGAGTRAGGGHQDREQRGERAGAPKGRL